MRCGMVEGAYSLICMTPRGHDRLPRSARHPPAGDGQARRRDGVRQRDRRASTWSAPNSSARSSRANWSQVDFDGKISSHRPFGNHRPRPCIFEHVYFSRPNSIFDGRSVYEVAQGDRRRTGEGSAGRGRSGRAGARQRRARGDRLCAAIGHSVRARHHPLALCRAHLHPAVATARATPSVKRKHNANRALVEGKRIVLIDNSIVRGTTSHEDRRR